MAVHATVGQRPQASVNQSLEGGLALHEPRHPKAKGLVQGSAVVLLNLDAAILAGAGSGEVHEHRRIRMDLDATVPGGPMNVPTGADPAENWIADVDAQFKGPVPARQAFLESRSMVVAWNKRTIGPSSGHSNDTGAWNPLPSPTLHQYGARCFGNGVSGAGGGLSRYGFGDPGGIPRHRPSERHRRRGTSPKDTVYTVRSFGLTIAVAADSGAREDRPPWAFLGRTDMWTVTSAAF